mmetsp:Transcript_23618/g.38060  ORF Transcript_23618/g.38060 Transcript_23618/m.38060 type:complete len:159 (-) Transcript_23618:42-518(-)
MHPVSSGNVFNIGIAVCAHLRRSWLVIRSWLVVRIEECLLVRLVLLYGVFSSSSRELNRFSRCNKRVFPGCKSAAGLGTLARSSCQCSCRQASLPQFHQLRLRFITRVGTQRSIPPRHMHLVPWQISCDICVAPRPGIGYFGRGQLSYGGVLANLARL